MRRAATIAGASRSSIPKEHLILRGSRVVLALLVLAGAIVTCAGATSSADPGITDTTILLGGTAPLSGTESAYASVARGANAYFQYVNARGGVNGRAIAYRVVDDAYDPTQTVAATRRLVEQDKVFAIFNSLGTEHNVAVRSYLNASKVPQLFVASGATTFGRDFARFPWTIGFQPSHRAEGWIYGSYLARSKPGAKVAVLHQNDDYGKDLLAGLRQGVARSKARVVAAQPYEVTSADVQPQLARLRASGADVLALFTTPRLAVQAYAVANRLNWRPLVITSAVASDSGVMTQASESGSNRAVENSVSIAFLKDPTDVRWRDDRAMRLYRTIMARYATGANVRDVHHVHGMAAAYEAVRVLKAAGKTPTRAAVMAQTRKLTDASNPFLLPGVAVRTAAGDRFPIEQSLLQRWAKGRWQSFGGLWGYWAG